MAAAARLKRLMAKGYPSFLVNPSWARPAFYKVQIGRYKDRSEAERVSVAQEGRTVPALDFALALLSGVLLALSFPKFGHPAFAWIALAPLVVAGLGCAVGVRARRAFLLGRPTGSVYFGCTLYWLAVTISTFGGPELLVGRRRGRCWSPISRSFPRSSRSYSVPPSRSRFVAEPAARAPRCGWPRRWAGLRLGRLSLGASRIQPGDGAAGCADGGSVGVYGLSALVASVSTADSP